MYIYNSRTQETEAGGSKSLKSTFHRIRPCQREGGKKERNTRSDGGLQKGIRN